MIFYVVSLVVFLFTIFDFVDDKKLKSLVSIVLLIILSFFAGFRNSVDTSYYYYDTNNYTAIFLNTKPLSIDSEINKETGFLLINAIVRTFTNNEICLFLVISVVCLFLTYRALKRYTNKPLLGLLAYVAFFFFIREFGQIRASLAYCIIINGIGLVYGRKFLKYIILVGIATSIHTSAILALLIYFLPKFKVNNKQLYTILIFSILLYQVNWLSYILPFFEYSNTFFVDKLLIYSQSAPIVLDMKRILLYLICVIAIRARQRALREDVMYDIKLKMLVFSIVLIGFLHESSILAVRIPDLYLTSIILIIPSIVGVFKSGHSRLLIHQAIAWSLLGYSYLLLTSLDGLVY